MNSTYLYSLFNLRRLFYLGTFPQHTQSRLPISLVGINAPILPTYLPTYLLRQEGRKAGPLIASCTTFCINAFGINGGSEKMSPYYNQCNDTTWGSFFLFFWILVKILEREFSLKCYFTCFTYYLLYYLNSLLNRLTRSTGQKRCHLLHKSSKFSDLLFALFLLVAK